MSTIGIMTMNFCFKIYFEA